MREDGSDAGANVVAADDGRVSNEHAFNIRDGVEWTSWKYADRDAEVTSAWAVLCVGGLCHGSTTDKTD